MPAATAGGVSIHFPHYACCQTSQSAATNNYGFDANGDGIADQMTSGSDADGAPMINDCVNPQQKGCTNANSDFQRALDNTPDFNSEGLLSGISEDDLKNTDIFIFRLSTGQLLVHQVGLKDKKIFANNTIQLRMPMPGPMAGNNIQASLTSTLKAWQTSSGLTAALQGRHVDAIRPGEPVEVVVLNRATGYIGTVRTSLVMPGSAQNIPITLSPPNLKIQVVRFYKLNGNDAQHTVGYRGAASEGDTYVEIRTEWLDQDGLPLPDCSDESECGLALTGRLATVSDNRTLTDAKGVSAGGDKLARFAIKPGIHTQMVMLNGGGLDPHHYYLQVAGESPVTRGYFSASGNGGAFDQRPRTYAPVRVPVFDEQRYTELRNAAAEAGEDINNVPETYQWPYRPEMNFSVIQLAQQEKLVIHYKNSTETKTIDLSDPNADISPLLDDNIDYAELFYGIDDGTQGQDLPAVGAAPQEYIFDIGGDEKVVSVGSGSVKFQKLDSLQDVQGSDLLSLSLYLNSDPSNVLQQVELPGLFACYQAPSPLHRVTPDKTSTKDLTVYRTLGGMRLMLRYQPHEDEEVTGYEWLINPANGVAGQWYKDFKADSKGTVTPPLTQQVYWQPDKWKLGDAQNGDTFQGKLYLTLADGSDKEVDFNILRRTLVPPASSSDDPMEGQDVRMLEGVLWHIGMSPDDNPGISGVRLDKSKRDVYKSDSDLPSIGRMVGRFKYLSYSSITSHTAEKGMDDYNDERVLEELGRHWRHYLETYDTWDHRSSLGLSDLSADDFKAVIDVFDGNVDYTAVDGKYQATIDATYTDKHNTNVQTATGTHYSRLDILKGLSLYESKGVQMSGWRTELSGAGETGARGLDQIVNRYTYGGLALDGDSEKKGGCPGVSAYKADGTTSQINHYDPRQNLMAMAVFLATPGCGASFHDAFASGAYAGDYSPRPGATLAQIENVDIDATGKITSVNVKKTGINNAHSDDDYELLAKGLGGYYQGHAIFNSGPGNSWVDLLIGQFAPNSTAYLALKKKVDDERTNKQKVDKRDALNVARTPGMQYAIDVLHGARGDGVDMGYREYVWQVGTGTSAYCFQYGEKEWMKPDKNVNGTFMTWNDYKKLAKVDSSARAGCGN